MPITTGLLPIVRTLQPHIVRQYGVVPQEYAAIHSVLFFPRLGVLREDEIVRALDVVTEEYPNSTWVTVMRGDSEARCSRITGGGKMVDGCGRGGKVEVGLRFSAPLGFGGGNSSLLPSEHYDGKSPTTQRIVHWLWLCTFQELAFPSEQERSESPVRTNGL